MSEIPDGSVCPFRLGIGALPRGGVSDCIGAKCKLWREDGCALAGAARTLQAQAKPQPPARGPGGKFLKRDK
jgi:hypothetical protein